MKDILQRLKQVNYFINWYSLSLRPGKWFSVYRGAGMEFEKISRYDFGEDPRWINWKATARFGGMRTYKNTYFEERELKLMLLVDLSGSMDFGSGRASKRRLSAEVAAVLTHSALRFGDSIGCIGYSSGIDVYWPPGKKREYIYQIPNSLLTARSATRSGSGLSLAVEKLPKRRALVFILSDFFDDPPVLGRALEAARRRHDVVPIMLRDRRETELPALRGSFRLRDLEDGGVQRVWIGEKKARAFAEYVEGQDREVQALFSRYRLDGLRLCPDEDYIPPLAHLFLSRRRRRA